MFDRSNEDFDREIFQVEDEVLKRSAGALYDRMWGPHGRDTVRERWRMMKKSTTLEARRARLPR